MAVSIDGENKEKKKKHNTILIGINQYDKYEASENLSKFRDEWMADYSSELEGIRKEDIKDVPADKELDYILNIFIGSLKKESLTSSSDSDANKENEYLNTLHEGIKKRLVDSSYKNKGKKKHYTSDDIMDAYQESLYALSETEGADEDYMEYLANSPQERKLETLLNRNWKIATAKDGRTFYLDGSNLAYKGETLDARAYVNNTFMDMPDLFAQDITNQFIEKSASERGAASLMGDLVMLDKYLYGGVALDIAGAAASALPGPGTIVGGVLGVAGTASNFISDYKRDDDSKYLNLGKNLAFDAAGMFLGPAAKSAEIASLVKANKHLGVLWNTVKKANKVKAPGIVAKAAEWSGRQVTRGSNFIIPSYALGRGSIEAGIGLYENYINDDNAKAAQHYLNALSIAGPFMASKGISRVQSGRKMKGDPAYDRFFKEFTNRKKWYDTKYGAKNEAGDVLKGNWLNNPKIVEVRDKVPFQAPKVIVRPKSVDAAKPFYLRSGEALPIAGITSVNPKVATGVVNTVPYSKGNGPKLPAESSSYAYKNAALNFNTIKNFGKKKEETGAIAEYATVPLRQVAPDYNTRSGSRFISTGKDGKKYLYTYGSKHGGYSPGEELTPSEYESLKSNGVPLGVVNAKKQGGKVMNYREEMNFIDKHIKAFKNGVFWKGLGDVAKNNTPALLGAGMYFAEKAMGNPGEKRINDLYDYNMRDEFTMNPVEQKAAIMPGHVVEGISYTDKKNFEDDYNQSIQREQSSDMTSNVIRNLMESKGRGELMSKIFKADKEYVMGNQEIARGVDAANTKSIIDTENANALSAKQAEEKNIIHKLNAMEKKEQALYNLEEGELMDRRVFMKNLVEYDTDKYRKGKLKTEQEEYYEKAMNARRTQYDMDTFNTLAARGFDKLNEDEQSIYLQLQKKYFNLDGTEATKASAPVVDPVKKANTAVSDFDFYGGITNTTFNGSDVDPAPFDRWANTDFMSKIHRRFGFNQLLKF